MIRIATVLISGGMDSATCIHLLIHQGFSVRGVFIDYGQAAYQQERNAVDQLQRFFDIEVIHLQTHSSVRFGSGELVGRNAFLISSAIFLAGIHRGLLAIGVHAGTPYYDCSAGFVERMKQIAEELTDGQLTVTAPLLDWNKAQIYRYLQDIEFPVDITYSCEEGIFPPCGLCASCKDRRQLGC